MNIQRIHIASLGLCLAAVLISIALAAPQAEATPEWMLSPPPQLPAEVSAKAEKSLSLLTEILKISTTFSCETLVADKALLEVEGKSSGTFLFSGCQTFLNGTLSPECEPHVKEPNAGSVTTKALKGQLVAHESTSLTRLQPVSGETFATVEMGPSCPLGTKIPIIGVFYVKDSSGKLEAEEETHVLEVGPLTELWSISKTAEHKATLHGGAKLSLAGKNLGAYWSGLGS